MTAVIRSAKAGTLQHKPTNYSLAKHCACRIGCYCRDAACKQAERIHRQEDVQFVVG